MTIVYQNSCPFNTKNCTTWSKEFADDSLVTARGPLTALARRQDALYNYVELKDDIVFSLSNTEGLRGVHDDHSSRFYRYSTTSFMMPCELETTVSSPDTNSELLTPGSFAESLEPTSCANFEIAEEESFDAIHTTFQHDGEQEQSNETEEFSSPETFYDDCQGDAATLKDQVVPTLRVNRYSKNLPMIPNLSELAAKELSHMPAEQTIDEIPSFDSFTFESLERRYISESISQYQPKKASTCENTGCHFIRRWVYTASVESQRIQGPKYRLPLYRIPELRYEPSH